MNTQNGWTIISSNDLNRDPIPTTDVVPAPGLRKGDVSVVLHEVGRRFNQDVQKLVKGWAWGWALPQVLPGGTYSNHGSGTAIDLNAPNFPMVLSRMTSKQVAACRKIVQDMDGVVRWGGEYPGLNIDQMHFEIVGSASQVKKLADKIKSQGDDMVNNEQLNDIWRFLLGKSPTKSQRNAYVGKISYSEARKIAYDSQTYKNVIKDSQGGTLDVKNHLPSEVRNVYKAPASGEFVPINQTLYTKK